MVSTRKKKKNKKRFRLLKIFFPSCGPGTSRTIVRVQARGRESPRRMEEHRGQTKGGLNDVPIQARESTPNPNNCSHSGPERQLVTKRPWRPLALWPRSRTIIRFPRPDPEQAPFVIGEERPQTRRNPTPRPRKSPIQAPNPNKSTPIRPRAGPEHRLLPPHGVCGTILPYPLYLLLYFVCHVQ